MLKQGKGKIISMSSVASSIRQSYYDNNTTHMQEEPQALITVFKWHQEEKTDNDIFYKRYEITKKRGNQLPYNAKTDHTNIDNESS